MLNFLDIPIPEVQVWETLEEEARSWHRSARPTDRANNFQESGIGGGRIMIDNPKIKFSHRQRAAVVYIRQSHPSQMQNHPESTARQYALSEKAMALGWNKNQVKIGRAHV